MLLRTNDTLPPNARVVWSGTIARQLDDEVRRSPPILREMGLLTSGPVERLMRYLTDRFEPGALVAERADVDRGVGAALLHKLAGRGRVEAVRQPNPRFGEPSQRRNVWMYRRKARA